MRTRGRGEIQEEVSHSVYVENLIERRSIHESRYLCFMLDELAKAKGQRTKLQIELLGAWSKLSGTKQEFLAVEQLKSQHEVLNEFLKKNVQCSTRKSRWHEGNVLNLAMLLVSSVEVKPSFFIGPYQCDLYFPGLHMGLNGSRVARVGVAVEVDGGSHDEPDKIRKDENKEFYLQNCLGIFVHRVRVGSYYSETSKGVLKQLGITKKAELLTITRMWRRVSTETLAHWAFRPIHRQFGRSMIEELLGIAWEDVEYLVEICKSSKSKNKILQAGTYQLGGGRL